MVTSAAVCYFFKWTISKHELGMGARDVFLLLDGWAEHENPQFAADSFKPSSDLQNPLCPDPRGFFCACNAEFGPMTTM